MVIGATARSASGRAVAIGAMASGSSTGRHPLDEEAKHKQAVEESLKRAKAKDDKEKGAQGVGKPRS